MTGVKSIYHVRDDHFVSHQKTIDRQGDHGAISHSFHSIPEVNLVAAVIYEAVNRATVIADKTKPRRWAGMGPSEQADILAEKEELETWCTMRSGLPWQLDWCADIMRIYTGSIVDSERIAARVLGELAKGKWDKCQIAPAVVKVRPWKNH